MSASTVEFRALGPVEIAVDGRPEAAYAAKPRTLLSLLLLHVNRVAERDWLIDQLWAGAPPEAAQTTLRAYVYRLRRQLSQFGGNASLRGTAGGYALEVEAAAVDLHRFEVLSAQGRQALQDGETDDAVTAFEEALGLWRGTAAFAGIDVPAVRETARRLDELRLEVVELRWTAKLESGAPGGAVADLEALTAAHPLREALWRLLMLGLYRAGRQGDALEAYQRLYRHLDDELGVRPSPAVERLHRQILAGDPQLQHPHAARSSGAAADREALPPRRLPAAARRRAGSAPQGSGIEFRLLGPVEIIRDEERLGPSTAQQRAVLAMLLLDLGRVVSTGRLVAALWASEPPASARNSLRVHIARLRKFLAADPAVRLVTVGEGWRLECGRERIDLYRFRDLADRARSGPAEEAGALLRDALSLWRGPALADATGHWLTVAVAGGLEDERLAAVEERIDADLRLGASDVIPELSVLAAEHPLRERPARLLMSALHRSGRTAEGLEVFQRTRRRLVEDLGIEPSAALEGEHRRLLRGPDAAQAPARGGTTLPRQLPGDPAVFAGRAGQVARLHELLDRSEGDSGPLVATIAGIPGSGKTTLAVHWAHTVRRRFPDGQLYLNLRGFEASGEAVDPADAVLRFLDALGVPPDRAPADADARSTLYRSLLAEKRMLIVLDNARDEAQVRPLLPGSPGCCAVVTSRAQLSGLVASHGAHVLTLDVFDPAESRDLLAGRLGAARVRAEPEAARRIIERCAGLALSLTMVAARAAVQPRFPLSVLADEIESEVPLDAFSSPDAAVDLRAVFSWSYRQLSPDAARLFRLLGLHWGPDFTAAAAAALAGVPVGTVAPAIRELCRMRLVAEHAPGRFDLHDLLAAYAAELTAALDEPAVRAEAMRRMLDHYLHTARAAADVMAPHRTLVRPAAPAAGANPAVPADNDQATAWFDAERLVLVNAVGGAYGHGFEVHTWQLAHYLSTYLRRKGLGEDWLAVQRLAVAAADRSGDASASGVALYGLASAQIRSDHAEEAEAHLLRALEHFESVGDLDWQAAVYSMLCLTGEAVDDYAAALGYAMQSLDRYRRAGFRPGQARALNNIGHCRSRLGAFDSALRACLAALAMARELGDPVAEANTLDSLGFIHSGLGDHRRAIDCYQRSFDSLHLRGEQYLAAVTLHRLGDAHLALGDLDAALKVWKRSLQGFEDLDHSCALKVRAKLTANSAVRPGDR